MAQFLSTETLIIELLLIASLVAMAVRRLRIPYSVALVVVGLLLTTQSPVEIDLTPELILALFVPPLVFEAAFQLNFDNLRASLPTILLLAVPGVILTTLVVGGMLVVGPGLALSSALIFGALIAATDPVAVISLFRILGVPKRLAVLVEGESLFNDGTAIVLFNMVLAFALIGKFDLLHSFGDFVRVSVGGVMVGLLLGWLVSRLIARVDDYLIETTFTTILAFGSYLLAEQLHLSGVLAVVAAGLVNGNLGSQGMSPTTRIVLFNFWEYVAFLANSMIFLMIGLQVNIPDLLQNWQTVVWAILAVILARVLVVYGLGWVANRWLEPISLRWQHVMTWGGLRGAISLALALSLPAALGPDQDLLRTMAFGVVLFTLLVPGTTISHLIRRLKIITRNDAQVEYELRHARLTALRSARVHLEQRHREGLISDHAWEALKPRIAEQITYLAEAVREVMSAEPALQEEELDTARREALRAERSAYLGLRRDGVISDENFEKLVAEVDGVLDQENTPLWFVAPESLPQRLRQGAGGQVDVAEFTIEAQAPIAGRQISQVEWPPDCLVASLRRDYQVVVPRGDTVLHAGDVLVVVASRAACEVVRRMCQAERPAVFL
jgi:monovalent cation:H+ antiporter, CPA1 family